MVDKTLSQLLSPSGDGEAHHKVISLSRFKNLASSLLQRTQLAIRAGLRFDNKRDYNTIFGYKTVLESADFHGKYQRQAIAGRVIDAPPEATWSQPPMMVNTSLVSLAKKWEALVKEQPVWTTLERADRLSRLGLYSIILVGLDDFTDLSQPTRKGAKITFLRALGDHQVTIESFVANPTDPRFGKPEMYKVDFEDPRLKKVMKGSSVSSGSVKPMLVHWSRIVHIVEKPLDDDILATPIIERCFNLLDDLLKITGGTPEIYWLNARGGFQADIDKDMSLDDDDTAELADEVEEYVHQLRRFIRTRGVTINDLQQKVPNPQQAFDMLMSLLSGATGIPKRILLGSEAGQLASEQDRANWAERIMDRRVLTAVPYMLNPLVGCFQRIGILPEGTYEWEWPEAFRVSPLEQAQTAAARARAVGNLSRQTGNKQPMQVVTEEEAREIVGLKGKIPDSERIEIIPEVTPGGDIPPDEEDE